MEENFEKRKKKTSSIYFSIVIKLLNGTDLIVELNGIKRISLFSFRILETKT